ncbi:MAG: HD domain-containing protein [Clostridia bacterium]|nr:HD domain-containing protein [Clostridia bacterium]
MKPQPQLATMIKGQVFDGYLMVRASAQRTSSNGGKYLDMTLCDISGEVNAKMWDGATPPPPAVHVIRLRGMMLEYNGRPQLRVDKLRLANEGDDYDMAALTPCAPLPPEEMLGYIRQRVNAFADEELKALVLRRLEDCGEALNYYPAASKLHHAERSGLLHHTSTMLRAAGAICEIYPTLDGELLAAGVILHDLCKITEIKADAIGLASDYTAEGMLIGHLVLGVSELARVGRELNVRPELLMMLEHMILSHHDLPEYGSPKPPMFPEAEVLHVLDLLDARIFEMNRELQNAQPGGFTERIWSLERKLYRRKEPPRGKREE